MRSRRGDVREYVVEYLRDQAAVLIATRSGAARHMREPGHGGGGGE
ncbi:hypothetical protein ACFYO2_46585 [Streptomyces sp. NPDC006602]